MLCGSIGRDLKMVVFICKKEFGHSYNMAIWEIFSKYII